MIIWQGIEVDPLDLAALKSEAEDLVLMHDDPDLVEHVVARIYRLGQLSGRTGLQEEQKIAAEGRFCPICNKHTTSEKAISMSTGEIHRHCPA